MAGHKQDQDGAARPPHEEMCEGTRPLARNTWQIQARALFGKTLIQGRTGAESEPRSGRTIHRSRAGDGGGSKQGQTFTKYTHKAEGN